MVSEFEFGLFYVVVVVLLKSQLNKYAIEIIEQLKIYIYMGKGLSIISSYNYED